MKVKEIIRGEEQRALSGPPEALERLEATIDTAKVEPNCPIYSDMLEPMQNLRKLIIANELHVSDDALFDIHDEAVYILQDDNAFLKYLTRWNENSLLEIFNGFNIINEYTLERPMVRVFPALQEDVKLLRSFGVVCAIMMLNGFVFDRQDRLLFFNADGLQLVFM